MTDRIASDEPDVVGLVPKPVTFWHRGHEYAATVSKSSTTPVRIAQETGSWPLELVGPFGRAWLADPCSMILQDAVHWGRMTADKQAQADRLARRQAKAALEQEAIQARQRKTARW